MNPIKLVFARPSGISSPSQEGLTLREYYIGQAITGVFAKRTAGEVVSFKNEIKKAIFELVDEILKENSNG